MTDIAERLRNYGDSHLKGCPAVITEAVAEIERLRKEVEELRDVVGDELTAESQRLGLY